MVNSSEVQMRMVLTERRNHVNYQLCALYGLALRVRGVSFKIQAVKIKTKLELSRITDGIYSKDPRIVI